MKKISFAMLVILLSAPLIAASADMIVVVDQSGSITKNMPVIKEYIRKSIFNKISKKDDLIYIFSFDGKFYFEGKLKGDAKLNEINKVLAKIRPVGMYTDLTNAVEKMTTYIQKKTDASKKKVVFFLTDGVNDPPYFSPYREGLKHRFFKEAYPESKTFSGWRVFITGIGDKTDAGTVARLIGADYVELSSSPTLSEFDQKLTDKLKEARGSNTWIIILITVLILTGGTAAYFFIWRR